MAHGDPEWRQDRWHTAPMRRLRLFIAAPLLVATACTSADSAIVDSAVIDTQAIEPLNSTSTGPVATTTIGPTTAPSTTVPPSTVPPSTTSEAGPTTWQPVGPEARILLIGDSISIGYTNATQRGVGHPQPQVIHHEGNAQSTSFALSSNRIFSWLGEGQWDVIHFNFGLHDLGWADVNGKEVDVGTPGAGPRVSLDEYERNLQTIVDILASRGDRLIWASTTPVFETSGSREEGAQLAYNQVATRVMERNGIQINDLHGYAVQNAEEFRVGGRDNVHFTETGYQKLAEPVVELLLS